MSHLPQLNLHQIIKKYWNIKLFLHLKSYGSKYFIKGILRYNLIMFVTL